MTARLGIQPMIAVVAARNSYGLRAATACFIVLPLSKGAVPAGRVAEAARCSRRLWPLRRVLRTAGNVADEHARA